MTNNDMTPSLDEIADGIFRISTFVPQVGPTGFSFNQFLVVADEPLLFHTGTRGMFPSVAETVSRVVPVESLRWIMFGHVEADESGAMNMWLASAPNSQVAHNMTGVLVSLNDLADRPPRGLADGEVLDLGGKRVRQISTPHVPHAWEAQVIYEETTNTLLCGDLLSQTGPTPAVTTDDVVDAAMVCEEIFQSSSIGPRTAPTLRMLADLEPTTLAIMHGASFKGDGGSALRDLADRYEKLLVEA
jgi:flavorubredoxin